MTTWIFQGNPDRFKVNKYLNEHNHIYWTVSRPVHQDRVKVGDTVFIWRAKGKTDLTPGVVGMGTIVESCQSESIIADNESLRVDLWTDEDRKKDEMKAGINLIEKRLTELDGMLTLNDLRQDPILSQMQVITFRVGSNFPLSEQQAKTLKELWRVHSTHFDEEIYGGYEATEGKVKLAIHKNRERDRRLVDEAKAAFKLEHGRVYCEICNFSFEEKYGEHGQNYIEAHHVKPVADLEVGETTSISDLIMVCSNCHRMIHHKRDGLLDVDELKALIIPNQSF